MVGVPEAWGLTQLAFTEAVTSRIDVRIERKINTTSRSKHREWLILCVLRASCHPVRIYKNSQEHPQIRISAFHSVPNAMYAVSRSSITRSPYASYIQPSIHSWVRFALPTTLRKPSVPNPLYERPDLDVLLDSLGRAVWSIILAFNSLDHLLHFLTLSLPFLLTHLAFPAEELLVRLAVAAS